MSLPSRQQQRIDRAPIRRSISATAKVTEPPRPAPPSKNKKHKPLSQAKACGLLVLNEDGSDTFAYRAITAAGQWTISASLGDTTFMPYSPMINKGLRIAYPGDSHYYLSADRGSTWDERGFPAAATFAPYIDRAPSGRFWTVGYDDKLVYFSDDELVSFSSSGSALSCTYIYGISASLSDANRIVVTHDNLSSSALYVTLTTDGGSSWASHAIGAYATGIVLCRSDGRLIAIVLDSAAHHVYGLYSDDDGSTWSSPTTLATLSGGNYFRLVDWRISRRGTVFAALDNGNTDTNVGIIRTADGSVWEVLDPIASEDVSAIAYCDNSGVLYVVHQSTGIYMVHRAATQAADLWASSALLLSNAPAGSYVGNVFAAYMVTI